MGKKQPIISNNSRKESTCSRSSATSSSSRRSIVLREGAANIQIVVTEPGNSDDDDTDTESVEDILKEPIMASQRKSTKTLAFNDQVQFCLREDSPQLEVNREGMLYY